MKTKWSKMDEQELRSLTERKAAFDKEARGPLEKLVREFDMRPDPDYNNVIERLIIRAEAFRDALEPFDSGARHRAEVRHEDRYELSPEEAAVLRGDKS